jgi:hypothetical protein
MLAMWKKIYAVIIDSSLPFHIPSKTTSSNFSMSVVGIDELKSEVTVLRIGTFLGERYKSKIKGD